MTDDTLLDELEQLMSQASRWGNTFVQNKKIRALIAHYREKNEQQHSLDPGKYMLKPAYTDAIQHDGTSASADAIQMWVGHRDGYTIRWTEGPLDLVVTYLRVIDTLGMSLLGPTDWLLHIDNQTFVILSNTEFTRQYIVKNI